MTPWLFDNDQMTITIKIIFFSENNVQCCEYVICTLKNSKNQKTLSQNLLDAMF